MNVKRFARALLFCLLLLLLLQTNAWAQSKTITGVITDEKNAPVSGASVLVKGTTTGTSTNTTGNFTLNVPATATTLTVSYVGYTSQDVNVTSQTSVTVSLVPETQSALNEVVVIGYGTARKRDLTGSIASVAAKDFNKGTYTAPDQLIQGKVAGVLVIANSGQPGAAATVKIRGNSAVTGTGQPLYVVDGIPLDGRSARPGVNNGANGLGVSPGGNPLNFINPNDIASMEVLKDASATAIYGSRAAYGVILITTKRGQSGLPKLDLGASVGVSSIMKKLDVLDASQYREALKYYGVPESNDKGENVDALGAILRTGITQSYNLAVSGGNENGRYRLSTGLLDQQGIVRKTDFKKYSVGLSANFKFLPSKKLGLDFNVISSQYTENIAPISNDAGANGSLIGLALSWNPTAPLKVGDSLTVNRASTIINPLALSEAYHDNSKVTNILGSISPYFKIIDGLEYRMLYSINYSSGIRRNSIDGFINLPPFGATTQVPTGLGYAAYANNELIQQQITHTLNFNKNVSENVYLNAVVGYEYLKYGNKGASLNAQGPANGGFGAFGLDYSNYLQYSNSGSRTISSFVDPTYEIQSVFGRASVNILDRYLITATFRSDGSSKFGENNRYGYFPSFAAAWDLSKESFFKVNAINQLKVRVGYGITGNQEFPSGSSQTRYSFSNNGGLGLSNNPNPDLKWQSDKQLNVGIDFGLFKSRITGSVDYFTKTTTDLLYPSFPIQPAPPGTVIRWINLDGEIHNKGVEISLNGNIIQGTAFTWNLGINTSFIKNSVEGLAASIQTGQLNGQGVSGTLVEVIRNGLPINAFYTRRFEGLDKTTGQAIYTDNGNTFYYLGNPNPKNILGVSTTLSYKKVALVVNMNGAFGQSIYNNTLNNVVNVGNINRGRNIAVSVYKSPVKEAFSNPVTSSSRFIEKGDYMKLANATLSYSIGDVAKIIKGAYVFVTGQNLFVITKFSGFDPEVNVDKSNNSVPSLGIEYTPYPTPRIVTLGVNFSL